MSFICSLHCCSPFFFFVLDFSWHRITIRTSLMLVIVATAIAVPNFGPVLSLAGGTFFTLLNVIFPLLFYCKLTGNVNLFRDIFVGILIILSLVTAFGNGYVEVKNVIKVIQGKYEITWVHWSRKNMFFGSSFFFGSNFSELCFNNL